MKKLTHLLLAALMLLSLTACGGKAPEKEAAAAPAEGGAWAPKENITMIVSYKAGSGTELSTQY